MADIENKSVIKKDLKMNNNSILKHNNGILGGKPWKLRNVSNNVPNFLLLIGIMISSVILNFNWAYSEILFQESFDDIPDWHTSELHYGCDNLSCKDQAPGAWDFFNNDELWHPNFGYPSNMATNYIDSQNYYGAYGKALTHWSESNIGRTNDGWANDGVIDKYLGKDFPELYLQMYIKFQPNYQMRSDPGSSSKMVRIYHWDKVGSVFSFFSGGDSAPIYVYFPGRNIYYDSKQEHLIRCKPQTTNYTCKGNYGANKPFVKSPTFKEFIGDGNWHKYDWHIKLNSSPGTEDGVLEFWVDNILQHSRYDIQFVDATYKGEFAGWNVVGIGGNSNNIWADSSTRSEQWYAIDNVTISTTPILSKPEITSITEFSDFQK